MRKTLLVSTLLVSLATTACTPRQKKIGAGTLAVGSAAALATGVGAFVEGQCPSDPYESCDTQPLMHGIGTSLVVTGAVLAIGAGLLYMSAKRDEREAAPAPAPAVGATFGGLPVATE